MHTQIFIVGNSQIPTALKKEKDFNCHIVSNPYNLRSSLQQTTGEKVVIVFLSFLEIRHFEIYDYLQKTNTNLKIFFVVEELSYAMKTKLKSHNEFIVLWKTEEANLSRDIHAYLNGRKLHLRQDKRESHQKNGLLSPSILPHGSNVNKNFQPMLGSHIKNISLNGSCLKIKANFYEKKDFVSLTYQSKEGEFITVEGQIRWTKWNALENCQELGVQLLAQT
ncbi:MAG: PilZ domain-containing protein [Bdellovibrio sp.]